VGWIFSFGAKDAAPTQGETVAHIGPLSMVSADAQLGEIFELKIGVRAGVGGDLLVIDAQRITHLIEQSGDGVGGDGNAECEKFRGDSRGGSAGPT